MRHDAQGDPDRRKLDHLREYLLEVNAVLLQEPFAARRALYRSMRPSTVTFTLSTHLLLTVLRSCGRGAWHPKTFIFYNGFVCVHTSCGNLYREQIYVISQVVNLDHQSRQHD